MRTARWPRTATPVDRNPDHAHARAALTALLDRPETHEGALDVLEPLAQARGDFNELLGLYERRLESRDDPARTHPSLKMAEVAADPDRQPRPGAGSAGPRVKEEADAGRGAGQYKGNGNAGAAKMPGAGAAEIKQGIGDADPEAARELALRAARLYVKGGDAAA